MGADRDRVCEAVRPRGRARGSRRPMSLAASPVVGGLGSARRARRAGRPPACRRARRTRGEPAALRTDAVDRPEGGWTEDELRLLAGYDARAVTLGRRTLRAESAAIVGLSVLHTLWGSSSKTVDGVNGVDGVDGVNGVNGVDGVNGVNGVAVDGQRSTVDGRRSTVDGQRSTVDGVEGILTGGGADASRRALLDRHASDAGASRGRVLPRDVPIGG